MDPRRLTNRLRALAAMVANPGAAKRSPPSQVDIVAAHWGQAARERATDSSWKGLSWDAHPVVDAYINERATNGADCHWLEFVRRFAPDGFERALSIGCGTGALERHALQIELCRFMEGCDIAPESLTVAREMAVQESLQDRVEYFRHDLDSDDLPIGRYDACFSAAALHHVSHLEHAVTTIARSLRPDGLIVLMEYVGPNRFQWTDRTQDLMQQLLRRLPPSQRRNLRTGDGLKHTVRRPTVEEVMRADPSESPRSADIVNAVQKHFDVLHAANIGGTLLHFLLADIVGNFDVADEKDVAMLELLTFFEQTLIDEGIIASDFRMIVGQVRADSPSSVG